MRVQDLMTSPAITCHVNDTLQQAAMLMWEHDCGALPVVNDEGKVTSLITDRDICMAAYTQGRSLNAILVNSAMAHEVVAVRPDHTVDEIQRLMADHQLRRLPVVDASGFPLGMVSLNDLAVECVEPDTRMKNGPAKVAHTLAAICAHRRSSRNAA